MHCLNCNKELIGTGNNPKKYCNDKCRIAFSRKKQGIVQNQVKNEDLENAPESIRLNEPEPTRTELPLNPNRIEPEQVNPNKPANYGLIDCTCQMCKTNIINGNKGIINHGQPKPIGVLAVNESNRVSLPGDVDYDGIFSKPMTAHCIKCNIPMNEGMRMCLACATS